VKKIDKEEYQKRLDRITELFSDMVRHADELSTHRCPYKNRFDECTAKFGCRNQRRPGEAGKLLLCAADDKLNYRSAWEIDPEEEPDLWIRDRPSDGDDISRW
jgi:hypothetical protein